MSRHGSESFSLNGNSSSSSSSRNTDSRRSIRWEALPDRLKSAQFDTSKSSSSLLNLSILEDYADDEKSGSATFTAEQELSASFTAIDTTSSSTSQVQQQQRFNDSNNSSMAPSEELNRRAHRELSSGMRAQQSRSLRGRQSFTLNKLDTNRLSLVGCDAHIKKLVRIYDERIAVAAVVSADEAKPAQDKKTAQNATNLSDAASVGHEAQLGGAPGQEQSILSATTSEEFCDQQDSKSEVTTPATESQEMARDDETDNQQESKSDHVVGPATDSSQLARTTGQKMKGPSSPCSMVTILGSSGSGKTTLAQQLKTKLQSSMRHHPRRKPVFFCTGKFDMDQGAQHRHEPYTAFIQALGELSDQILDLEKDEIEAIKNRIEESIGEEIWVLTDLVPALKELFGWENEHFRASAVARRREEAAATNRGNQLHFIFRNFIRAICNTGGHPLVLVLDDIHWADSSSLFLVETLLTDPDLDSFLLLTTCRSDEQSQGHPFSFLLKSLERQQVHLEEIHLRNLDPSQVHMIVQSVLRCDDDAETVNPLSSLSEVIHQKTHGNPFFVLSFLQNLVEEGSLDYNLGTLRWNWSIDTIQAKNVTENVADLTAVKLNNLSAEKKITLQVAACLSQTFARNTLDFCLNGVKDDPNCNAFEQQDDNDAVIAWPTDLDDVLGQLLDDGILESKAGGSKEYSFVHDQIQSAALKLVVSAAKRPALQLSIGHRLIQGMDESQMDDYLYLAVDLCNSGINFVKEKDLHYYAKWELLAGDRALKHAAYPAALLYLEMGVNCLGGMKKCWDTNSELALLLYSGVVEAAYCTGDLDKLDKYAVEVLERKLTVEEKYRVYCVCISAYGAQERFQEACDTGRTALKETGLVDFPKAPGIIMVIKELLKTRRVMKGHTQETLLSLPPCTNIKRIVAMGIINQLTSMAYMTNPNFFLIMYLKSMRWTVKHGLTEYSPVAISTYGVILCSVLKDVNKGLKLGETALALAEARNLKAQNATTISAFYGYVHHWKKPMKLSIAPLKYGHQVGMKTGEVELAFICLANHDTAVILTASKCLHEFLVDLESHCKYMLEYNQQAIRAFLVTIWQFALNMTGQCDNRMKLTGIAMDERDIRRVAREKDNRWLEVLMDYWRMQLAYLFGDYEAASEIAATTMDFGIKVGQGTAHVARHTLFVGLIATAMASTTKSKAIQKKNLKISQSMRKRLRSFLSAGNPNCLHMNKLLEAEIASCKKDNVAAETLYKDAVLLSGRAGFIHDKAVAHERASTFFENNKDDAYWAAYHLELSIECYRDFGATEKVNCLVDSNQGLLDNTDNVGMPWDQGH